MKTSEFRKLIREEIRKILKEASALPIQIVKMIETLDNSGRQKTYKKQSDIELYLKTPDEWTDDVIFYDNKGEMYFIDDLDGKDVQVNNKIFTVKDTN